MPNDSHGSELYFWLCAEEETKRHKDKKAKKHKKEKKEKKSRKDDREKELLKAAKNFLKTSTFEHASPMRKECPAVIRLALCSVCITMSILDSVTMAFQCAELKGEESQPTEDDTPLDKGAEIEEITADDYFIKNAEVPPPAPTLVPDDAP